MPEITVKLKTPVNINVNELAKFFPEYNYHDHPFLQNESIINQHDGRFQHIISFREKTELGFNLIATEIEPVILAALLTRVPVSLSTLLKNCFEENKFSLPNPSTSEIEKILQRIAEDEKKFGVITRVLTRLITYKSASYQPNEVLFVPQKEIAFTNSTNKFPVLASGGAYECVIVAAYNKANQSAALAHVDCGINLTNLVAHIESLRTTSDEKITLNLAGGTSLSSRSVDELIRALSEISNSEIEAADLYQAGRDSDERRLSIDTRNGEVARSIPSLQLAIKPYDLEANFLETQICSMAFTHEQQTFPLRVIYTHKTSQVIREEKHEGSAHQLTSNLKHFITDLSKALEENSSKQRGSARFFSSISALSFANLGSNLSRIAKKINTDNVDTWIFPIAKTINDHRKKLLIYENNLALTNYDNLLKSQGIIVTEDITLQSLQEALTQLKPPSQVTTEKTM